MPLFPSSNLDQTESSSIPRADTIPMPVIATRLLEFEALVGIRQSGLIRK